MPESRQSLSRPNADTRGVEIFIECHPAKGWYALVMIDREDKGEGYYPTREEALGAMLGVLEGAGIDPIYPEDVGRNV